MSFRKTLFTVFAVVMLLALSVGIVACTPKNRSNDSTGDPTSTTTTDDSSTSEVDPGEAEDLIVVYGVNANANFTLRDNAKSAKSTENKKTEFMDLTQDFYVGDDNPFVVKPSVAFLIYRGNSQEAEEYVPDEWTYYMNVYRFVNKTYVALNEEDYATFIEAFDATNATVDFSTEAIGELFKLEVYPEGLTANQQANANYKSTVEVRVINGYNAYTALDLAYVEKGGREEAAYLNDVWAEFKEEQGLTANVAEDAVILQANINITKDDLPEGLFWTADDPRVSPADSDYDTVIGSLRDYASIYSRNLSKANTNDTFTFEGNYFTVNIKSLPLVVRYNDNIAQEGVAYESHTTLFRFTSDVENNANLSATIKNVNFVGNAPRVENTEKCGGVITVKANKVCFEAYNNISNAFVINYMAERSKLPFYLTKCRVYDAMTCLVYVYGNNSVVIRDSDLNGAGGPAMIVDHVRPDDGVNSYTSSVTLDNSEVHSYVTGQEAWFKMYGVSENVGQIALMSGFFEGFFGRSFVKTREVYDEDQNKSTLSFIDFVAAYKTGTTEQPLDALEKKVTGYFKKSNEAYPMDFGTYTDPWDDFAKTGTTAVSATLEGYLPYGAPVFVTSGGGIGWFNGTTLAASAAASDAFAALAQGETIYLYYHRMGLVFNYFNAGETI